MAVIISDQNQGPVVNIVAWLGMTIMILSVFTRIGSKYSVIRRWTMDDTLITVTMVCVLLEVDTFKEYRANALVKGLGSFIHSDYLHDGRKRIGSATGNSQ